MERDFEREFRELKQNEIPDLWNRIEAGLSEKNNVTQVNNFEKGDTKKPFAWRKWGTLIAACVCVVIILPAFSLLIQEKGYSGSGSDTAANTTETIAEDNAAAMDTAAAENAESEFYAEDAAAAEEMIPENGMADSAAAESAEDVAGGTVAESAEGMAGGMAADAGLTGSKNEAAAGAAADIDAASETSAPDMTVEGAQIQETDEAENARKEEEKAVWNELTDGQMLEEAVIRIQKAETADGEVLYQAAVEQSDVEGILKSGTQIALVCNDDTEYEFLRGPRDEKELKEQEQYRVTLCYDAEGGRFVVLEAGSWEKQ